MTEALVSVAVVFFNQEDYIGETLESVCRQTYSRLQIIVVDDGSRDAGLELVKREFGDRVELFTQPNAGPSAATNLALRKARGEFVALLAGDDLCTPDRIAEQVRHLMLGEHDIVFSRPDLIDEKGEDLPRELYEIFFRKLEPRQAIFNSLLFDDNFLCAPSAMLRAELFRDVGFFHEGLIQLQDYDYWLRAAGQGFRLGVFDEPLIRYRRHPQNLSTSARNFATWSELPLVLARAVDFASSSVLRRDFPEILSCALTDEAPLNPFDRMSLLLAHPRPEVRAEGMRKLMTAMDDEAFKSFAAKAGLNPFQILYNAGSNNA